MFAPLRRVACDRRVACALRQVITRTSVPPWQHAVMSRLDDILAAHRPVDDAEATDLARIRALVASDPATGPWSRELPLHVTASALVVHPATRRVLLRWHARQGSWLHVGGHGDPGETDP